MAIGSRHESVAVTAFALAFGLCVLPSWSVADDTKWKLALEGGSEYDSNYHRIEVTESEEVDGGSLLRTAATAQLQHRLKPGQALAMDLRAATKLFTASAGQSENIGVVYGDGKYQSYVGDDKAVLAVRGNYYNAIDLRPFGDGDNPVTGRSFRSGELEISLRLPSEGEHQVTLLANTRDFLYKPDDDFSWRGEHLGVQYRTVLWIGDPDQDESAASVDVRASYRVGLRRFEGAAFRNTCSAQEMAAPECFVPTSGKRADMNHSGFAEAVYTGRNIYSLLYSAQFVDSNSYGQASVRHRVEASLTTELGAKVFLTARATLRLNTFLDPLLLARDVQSQSFISIEDENRNSLKLDFARDIGDSFAVEARLAIYSNEFATQELSFRRQTGYLGVIYRFSGE